MTTALLRPLFGLAAGLGLAQGPATAQDAFPSQPIEVITHASAGGGTDSTARTMLIHLQEHLGETGFVNIQAGGGGAVAMSYFAEQPADGHYLLAITPTHLFTMTRGNAAVTLDDLIGVVRGTDDPIVIMVRGDSPWQSLEDLQAAGAAGPITWGGTQIGGVDHIASMAYAKAAGIQLNYVPFDGGGEIVTNLMGGNIQAAGLNVTEARDQLQSGDLRALAVMSEARISFLPDTPTLVEKGMDVVFSTVRGYLVHKDVPEDRIAKLEQALLASMNTETFKNYLTGSGLDETSIAGREVWDAQVRRLYERSVATMEDLGLME